MKNLKILIDGENAPFSFNPLGDSGSIRYLGITAAGYYSIKESLEEGKKIEIVFSEKNIIEESK